jgi:hypothetical protein
MNPHVLTIIMFVLLLCALPLMAARETSDPKLDLDRVVEAIRIVENWDGVSVGAEGEVGPWQFKKSVWIEFSDKPFSWAWGDWPEQKAEQRAAARRYVAWIDQNLIHLPLPRTAASIALVYTNGWGNTKRKKITAAKRDYSRRAQNIYDEITAGRIPAAPISNP